MTTDTPTYDQLSALCPQMAAALSNVEAIMSIVEPRSDKAEYLNGLTEVRAALTAYRTLSPDPQWQIEELAHALFATNVPAGQRNTNWEALTDATKAAYRLHAAEMYAAINRARGEG